jgi:multiple sugar transport system ATP-binding protein
MGSVTLRALRKFYGSFEAIKGIDLTVADGELAVFVGPSGCGKSTLLRMIAGLEDVDYGDVLIDGVDVTETAPARRGVAMVFQNYALYPHMTAFGNMAYGLRRAGLPNAEVETRVRRAAAQLQIEPLLDRKPRAMSGGQRQRVAIGRAIVRDPSVFLFDEPLSNLDAALRIETRAQIARLHRELGATMIFVTHDQVEAMTLADRIVVLNAGRIEQEGPPREVYHQPANLFVAGFIGAPAMNLIPARIAARDGARLTIDTGQALGPLTLVGPFAGNPGDDVTLGLRPETIRTGGPHTAPVTHAEHLGGETILHLATGTGNLILRSPGDLDAKAGDAIPFTIDMAGACLFDAAGQSLRRPG